MKASMKILIIVSGSKQAEQAIKISHKLPAVIMALNLETEYFLKSRVNNYNNPIYDFLDKSSTPSQFQYIDDNFDIAYNWYEDFTYKQKGQHYKNTFEENDFYRYIRDRFGYFLIEFERSLNFAERVFAKLNPERIYLPEAQDYKGSSVMSGTLKPLALFTLAKTKKFQSQFLKIILKTTHPE